MNNATAALSTKWANKTATIIRSGVIPEGVIGSMRKILARAINANTAAWMTGTPSCNYDDAGALLELIAEHNPQVTTEQANKGANWLYSQLYTPTGAIRRTEFVEQFTAQDRDIVLYCRDNPRFDLVELYDTQQDGARFCSLFPVYRCHGPNRTWFDYVARAWQSGGNSFIVNRNR
jgi:hypothetical protein